MAHRRISTEPPTLREQIQELLGARDLYLILVGREIRVRYRQTALGIVWVVLQPLVPAVIFATVFGAFARLPSAGAPYLLFAMSGLVLYALFSGAVSRAGGSLVRDGGIVTKVYFPRAVLPIASGSAAILDFVVGLGLVLVIMAASGRTPGAGILLVPVIAVLTLALAIALGMATAALSAHYRDFAHVLPFVLQLLLYGSPVAYSMEILPSSLINVVALNPLVPLIESFRWALLGTPPPTGVQIGIGLLSGVTMFGIALLVFSRASRDVADVI